MALAINMNTAQKPMSAAGRTGTQSVKNIPAPRVYVKTVDSLTAAPVQNYQKKTNNGVLDASYTGWTDLGIVLGNAKVVYDKKVKQVTTGMDNVLRAAYADAKSAQLEFSLAQFDDVILEQLSGLTASVVTSGSVINYQVGQEDIIQKAILLVSINKLDQKEVQYYNPCAYINFVYEDNADGMGLKCTALLPSFTATGTGGAAGEGFMSTTFFA